MGRDWAPLVAGRGPQSPEPWPGALGAWRLRTQTCVGRVLVSGLLFGGRLCLGVAAPKEPPQPVPQANLEQQGLGWGRGPGRPPRRACSRGVTWEPWRPRLLQRRPWATHDRHSHSRRLTGLRGRVRRVSGQLSAGVRPRAGWRRGGGIGSAAWRLAQHSSAAAVGSGDAVGLGALPVTSRPLRGLRQTRRGPRAGGGAQPSPWGQNADRPRCDPGRIPGPLGPPEGSERVSGDAARHLHGARAPRGMSR